MPFDHPLRIVVAGVLLSLVAAACVRTASGVADEKPAGDLANPYAGKILLVYEKSEKSREHPFVIEGPAFARSGGLTFLVGTGVDPGDPDYWTRGLKISIAWDDVASIIEFPDMATYLRVENSARREEAQD
ncbi:MAG: hypothetical protein ACT4QC_20170 [Planctomycetaceae bacterium]